MTTSYPFNFISFPNKEKLLEEYKGKRLVDLPTPAFVIDRKIFYKNCEKMVSNARKLNVAFRPHIKSHKTLEGSLLQLGSGDSRTNKIVISTLSEAWYIMPLVKQGLIEDVLFSLPIVPSKLPELAELSKHIPSLRLMLDDVEQLKILVNYSMNNDVKKKWSLFIKLNMGTDRAGFKKGPDLDGALRQLSETTMKDYVELYGFYCHAGHSYGSSTVEEAKAFLLDEIESANAACEKALEIDSELKLQISVGATPTAHASELLDSRYLNQLSGNVELHAGNYPLCDLQQMGTHCIDLQQVSCRVLAEVISSYHNRGSTLPGEQLINAGVIALGREFGPIKGHGEVSSPKGFGNWIVGRLSQEHGILTPLENEKEATMIPIGTSIQIIPQHSCIAAAAYPWYYIVDGTDVVVDIWVPTKGW